MKEFLNAIQKHDFSEALEKNAQLNTIKHKDLIFYIYKSKKYINISTLKSFMNIAMLTDFFILHFKIKTEDISIYKIHKECVDENEIKKLLSHERVSVNHDFKFGINKLLNILELYD